jgi:hypothetical protein
MAYAPDEITLNDYPKSYNENIKEQKNKSLKKLKKKLLKVFYIFIGFIIGLLPTILILKN